MSQTLAPYQLSGPKNFLDSRAPWKVSRPPQNCASFTPLIKNLVAEGTSIDKVRIGKVSGNKVSDPPGGTVKTFGRCSRPLGVQKRGTDLKLVTRLDVESIDSHATARFFALAPRICRFCPSREA